MVDNFNIVLDAFRKLARYTYTYESLDNGMIKVTPHFVVDTVTSYYDKLKKCKDLGYV